MFGNILFQLLWGEHLMRGCLLINNRIMPHTHWQKEDSGLKGIFRLWYYTKHCKNCQTLPRDHRIGCQGVKVFLLKDPYKLVLFLINWDFHNTSFVTIWEKFCHNLSFWVLTQFDFGHILSHWVLSQFEFLRFITI